MTEGTITLLSRRSKFNIEVMGGGDLLFSAIEDNKIGVTYGTVKLTERAKVTEYRSRLEFDYTTSWTVTEVDIRTMIHDCLKRVDDLFNEQLTDDDELSELLYETEVAKVTTEKRKVFYPKKKDLIKCQWCGRTDCNHVNKE